MPIKCPGGEKPRYRWVKKGGKMMRLAFCGNKVIETKVKGKPAKKVKKKKSSSKKKR